MKYHGELRGPYKIVECSQVGATKIILYILPQIYVSILWHDYTILNRGRATETFNVF